MVPKHGSKVIVEEKYLNHSRIAINKTEIIVSKYTEMHIQQKFHSMHD
jgi:hypothetical protein